MSKKKMKKRKDKQFVGTIIMPQKMDINEFDNFVVGFINFIKDAFNKLDTEPEKKN
jgi:hypothetical protein